MNNTHNFVRYLLTAHENMRVILIEAANAEKTVQRTAQLMAVHKSDFTDAHRQLAVAVRLVFVNQYAAGAVHRLDAVIVIIDNRGVHVILVMIPVTACFPQLAVHDKRR